FIAGTTVDGYKFTDCAIISYFNCSFFFGVFSILRNSSYNSTRKNATVSTNTGSFHNGYVGTNPGTISNLYILVNNCKRVNLYISGHTGIRVYIGMWMNHAVKKMATF